MVKQAQFTCCLDAKITSQMVTYRQMTRAELDQAIGFWQKVLEIPEAEAHLTLGKTESTSHLFHVATAPSAQRQGHPTRLRQLVPNALGAEGCRISVLSAQENGDRRAA